MSRPATAGMKSPGLKKKTAATQEEIDNEEMEERVQAAKLARDAAAFFERFEKTECQELLAYFTSNWLLSSEFKWDFSLDNFGLITELSAVGDGEIFLMLPVDTDNAPPFEVKDVHTVIRELTVGIYVLSQTPNLQLCPNFDKSTNCLLPPAYYDTLVGQTVVSLDYWMKCLWHGVYMSRDQMSKFSEKWRDLLNVDPSTGQPVTRKDVAAELHTAGLKDLGLDPDVGDMYEDLPEEHVNDEVMKTDRHNFLKHLDSMHLQLQLRTADVSQEGPLLFADARWSVDPVIRLMDDEIDECLYARLQSRLSKHRDLIERYLLKKPEYLEKMRLLRLISVLTPLLCGLKRKAKCPVIDNLYTHISGVTCSRDFLKTERELPPLLMSDDFKSRKIIPVEANKLFDLHGALSIILETDKMSVVPEGTMESMKETLQEARELTKLYTSADRPTLEGYPLLIKEINGRKYHVIHIELEPYYAGVPVKPAFCGAMLEEINRLRPKRLPLTDPNIHDIFKKCLGYSRAIKCKNPFTGLKATVSHGMVGSFLSLSRKLAANRLAAQDEKGYALIHLASINNRNEILCGLITLGMDLSARRGSYSQLENDDPDSDVSNASMKELYKRYETKEEVELDSPTPLHMACRCGALEVVSCLISVNCNFLAYDNFGWAAIHHAAYFDHVEIIRLLCRRHDTLMEFETRDDLKTTPFLLAGTSGALKSVKLLLELGTVMAREDKNGNNIIHVAALNLHTNILEYFIEMTECQAPNELLPVWTIMVEMLKKTDFLSALEWTQRCLACLRCLDLLTSRNDHYWKPLTDNGGIPLLVKLLYDPTEQIQCIAVSVLCNVSSQPQVQELLAHSTAGRRLIELLSSPSEEIQARSAVVLGDMCAVEGNKELLAGHSAILELVRLLDSNLEDVLINAVNALRLICTDTVDNQTAVATAEGALPALVEFLSVDCDSLKAAAAACIAALAKGHPDNQTLVLHLRTMEPLVKLLKCRNISVAIKAAAAVEALATENYDIQQEFLELEAPKPLVRMLKMLYIPLGSEVTSKGNEVAAVNQWSIEVKEQTARALKALAGQTIPQQKLIASHVGIQTLIDLLLTRSEVLHYISGEMIESFALEEQSAQEEVAKYNGISPLLRLVRPPSKVGQTVLIQMIRTLGSLCYLSALTPHKFTQQRIAVEGGLRDLFAVATDDEENFLVRVEACQTVAYVVLSNKELQDTLMNELGFDMSFVCRLIDVTSGEIRLRAAHALSTFAFNNANIQFQVHQAGGLQYSTFAPYLESENQLWKAYAAFQVIVLCRCIIDMDQVTLTANGIVTIISILKNSDDFRLLTIAGNLLAALCHTRAGIPDAILAVDGFKVLVHLLEHSFVLVRHGVAVALGYLSFNATARRNLLSICRTTPNVYTLLMANIGPYKISDDFLQEYELALATGISAKPYKRATSSTPRPKTGARGVTCYPRPQTGESRAPRPKTAPVPAGVNFND